jgi:hypothetical protein
LNYIDSVDDTSTFGLVNQMRRRQPQRLERSEAIEQLERLELIYQQKVVE